MATFYNQATLNFGTNTLNSNTTQAELLSGLTITKTAITTEYEAGTSLAYLITVTNMSNTAYNALTVYDNLGAYILPDGVTTVVPLSYVDGSALFYLNGVLQATPDVSSDEELQIGEFTLPAGSTATFVYEAVTNEFAPIGAGAVINNTARVNGGTDVCEVTATATVSATESVSLSIAKAVCPAVVSCNEEVTYTIILQNAGNIPVNATDGLTVNDVFNPILSDISVAINGSALSEAFYTYDETTGEFATVNGAISIPSATTTQDSTGRIITTPGVTVITVTGNV